MSEIRRIESIRIHFFGNYQPIMISGDDIEQMIQATEAIEMLERAKNIAKRFLEVSK